MADKPNPALNSTGMTARAGVLVGAIVGLFAAAIGLGIGVIDLVYGQRLRELTFWSPMGQPIFWMPVGAIITIIAGIISGLTGLKISEKSSNKLVGGVLGGAVGGGVGAATGAVIGVAAIYGGVTIVHGCVWPCPGGYIFGGFITLLLCVFIGVIVGSISGLVIAALGVLIGGTLSVILAGWWVGASLGSVSSPMVQNCLLSLVISVGVWLSVAITMYNKGVIRSESGEAACRGALGAAIGGACGAVAAGLASFIFY